MRTDKSMIKRLFATLCVLGSTLATAADYPFTTWTEQFSRWKERPVDGAYDRMISGGPDGSTLITYPYNGDPMRSFDGGVTWQGFTVNGQRSWYVSIAPKNSLTWYARGNDDGRLYRTDDGGQTWSARGTPIPANHQASAVQISADPGVIYQTVYEVMVCDFNECPLISGTLQVSRDAGATWHDIGSPDGFQRAFASPVDPALVFSIGNDGLRRSRNQGATWEPVAVSFGAASGPPIVGQLTLDRFDTKVMYLASSPYEAAAPMLSTRDGGATWTSRPLEGGRIYADGIQQGRAYLFTYFYGAYETRDAGRTWVKVDPSIYTSANSNVAGVVLREGRRIAVGPYFNKLKELDLDAGALSLTSDLWWNPDESGWGLTITHRASTQTFIAWYAYDKDGAPVWRVVPGGHWADRTFTGDLYETTGSPYFGAAFDPSKVVPKKVGTARIVFDSENSAVFSYQVGTGESGNKRIVRQLFGPTVTWPVVDESYADLWWNAAESGWGIAISHQNDNIFATWFAYDDQGKPLWVVMPDAKVVALEAGATASGDIYTTRGPSSLAPFDPSQVIATKVGSAKLTFRAEGDAVLESTAFGRTETRTITRQPF